MNYALIFAGGVGSRMNYGDVPKQFLEIQGKSIIVLTTEKFSDHNDIDGVLIVCVEEHIERLKSQLQKSNVRKVVDILPGGKTAQESILIGLRKLKEINEENNTILIHDGVRPIIDDELISNNISTTKEYGSSVTVVSCKETILYQTSEEKNGYSALDRNRCIIARAPQCFRINEVLPFAEAAYESKLEFVDTYSLMEAYGISAKFVEGHHSNIKITTFDDYLMAKNLLEGTYHND
ncbi:2-C-methyl-D-erythritol 4-phosphate cytidylyltransferase [Vibrio sp. SCSIO 43133]|uniref:IspD/TarI family cytidylyltransferase n=1 Tax=Vibrio sp. SCSIO 43133 TaxID=2802577 RepID=UPI0020756938|nr:IspD/TarI family cytidylyltransferase [Vibrio sp. SCSIO 43133]USE00339.1 2-C-methyl-D-erythritol 4-phosphate cytidylyltransferase [Vibrio sp. SCSIO 43133]